MDKYYKSISQFLIDIDSINESDRELYEYALKVLFRSLTNVIIATVVGIIFGMIKECFCFLAVFIVLRKFTGGLHLEKYVHCLLCSTIMLLLSLTTIKCLENVNYNSFLWFVIVMLLSLMIFAVLAPCENHNKPLMHKEKKFYKLASLLFCAVCLVLMIVLKSMVAYNYLYAIGTAVFCVTILLIIGHIKEHKFIKHQNRT